MNITVLDAFTSNPGDLSWDALSKWGMVTIYDRTSPELTVTRAADADVVLTNKVVLGKDELAQLPRLRYIGVLATGYNVVDVEEAARRGIVVTNVPAYSTDSVAQMVMAHLLAVTNRVEHYVALNREGKWSQSPDFCFTDTQLVELAGKTMGIVALGNIGMKVARMALAMGMSVLASTSKPQDALPKGVTKVSIDEVFTMSDVVSLHCPLSGKTFHLVNEARLSMMKPSAVLINTARGPLVDEQAVAEALRQGKIAAYCADVLEVEPPSTDNPLLACTNAFITPHVAWATVEARRRLIEVAVDNVRAFLEGNPVNVVNGL